mgnify:CR=1 FL=1
MSNLKSSQINLPLTIVHKDNKVNIAIVYHLHLKINLEECNMDQTFMAPEKRTKTDLL